MEIYMIQNDINNMVYIGQTNNSKHRWEQHVSADLLKRLFYSLKYEQDKTMTQIAKEYGIDMSQLNEINQGRALRVDWQTYPIRKGKVYNPLYKHAEEIRNLLKNTDTPQKDIARKFNVSVSSVRAINKGCYYRDNKLSYPLRYNYQCYNGGRTALSPSEVREIEGKLKNTNISMRSIATEYEIPLTTVLNLNIGSIKKYRKESLNYPLRKL